MSAVNTVLLALLLADAPKEPAASPAVIRMGIINTSDDNSVTVNNVVDILNKTAAQCVGRNATNNPAVKARLTGTTDAGGAVTVGFINVGKGDDETAKACFAEKLKAAPIKKGVAVYTNYTVSGGVADPADMPKDPKELSMDSEEAKERVKDVREKVLACAKGTPPAGAKAKGTVQAKILIAKTGAVRMVEVNKSQLEWPEVERCVADTIAAFAFPEAKEGGAVLVSPKFELDATPKK